MRWERVALGDVTDSCLGKMLDKEKNKGEFEPYLANVDVRWGSFNLDNLSKMRFESNDQERYGLKYGDLVVCEGGEPGRCAIWKDQVPNMKIQKALHRVRVHDCLDYRYLYYWFVLAGKVGALEQYFTGATIKHMPGEKLKSILIDMPPLAVQQGIANILWQYDNLIENNQKQIKLLEEAAQRLYKEWFVDFHFPGYETTPIVDGVPEGWVSSTVGGICDTIGGGTPPTKNEEYYRDGQIKWVTPTDITRKSGLILLDTEKKITEEGLYNSSAKMVPPYTILMTSRASVGFFGLCEYEVCTNQGFISCIPHEENVRFYLLYNLMNRVDEIKAKASGATFLEIGKKIFKDLKIKIPPTYILDAFSKIVQPLIRQMELLTKSIAKLQEARDRLLPKLMNGEIEV